MVVPVLAGAGYTLSWIAGLAVPAPSPAFGASGATIVAALRGHGPALAAQFTLTEGLPAGRLGRIGVAVAAGGQKVFAIVAAGGFGGGGGGGAAGGLYRTDDGGAQWAKSTQDPRIQGSGYFSRVFLDPKNSDVVYVAQTSLYRSDDGGNTWTLVSRAGR